MRRTDREIKSRAEIDAVLHDALVCHVAMVADGEPYVVPLSFGYDGSSIYLHTAKAGRKIGCFLANNRVCFQVERDVRIEPGEDDACGWTFAFESVIGHGEVSELTGAEGKSHGLNQIMQHYSDKDWTFDSEGVARTRVWRIRIDTVTGKRSPGRDEDQGAAGVGC